MTEMHEHDETDRILSAYFQSQLPTAWPGIELPKEAIAPRGSSELSWTSKGALAASVTLLLGLGLFLATDTPTKPPTRGTPSELLRGATADGAKLLEKAKSVRENPMGNVPAMPMNQP